MSDGKEEQGNEKDNKGESNKNGRRDWIHRLEEAEGDMGQQLAKT